MKQNIYTLITYIAGEDGWHDRCGDYHSGKESSFETTYFNDIQKAIEALGKAQFLHDKNDNKVTLLINGLDLNDYSCEEMLSNDEYKKLYEEYEEIDRQAFEIRQNLEIEQVEIIKLAKFKKEAEEALKKRQEKEALEKRERQELAKLMAKYGK